LSERSGENQSDFTEYYDSWRLKEMLTLKAAGWPAPDNVFQAVQQRQAVVGPVQCQLTRGLVNHGTPLAGAAMKFQRFPLRNWQASGRPGKISRSRRRELRRRGLC